MCSGERPDRWVDGPLVAAGRARGQLAVMVAVHRSAGFRPRGARGGDRKGAPAGVAVLSLNKRTNCAGLPVRESASAVRGPLGAQAQTSSSSAKNAL